MEDARTLDERLREAEESVQGWTADAESLESALRTHFGETFPRGNVPAASLPDAELAAWTLGVLAAFGRALPAWLSAAETVGTVWKRCFDTGTDRSRTVPSVPEEGWDAWLASAMAEAGEWLSGYVREDEEAPEWLLPAKTFEIVRETFVEPCSDLLERNGDLLSGTRGTWLEDRMTEARLGSARWVSLARIIEELWETYFDPAIGRLEDARSSWTAAYPDLVRQLDLLGTDFSVLVPPVADRRAAVSWRRWELQYKDTEEILRLAFRRYFGIAETTWLPLFAPVGLPYGARFDPPDAFVAEARKYVPQEGMFLTSRGLFGANYSSLMRRNWTRAEFLRVARALMDDTRPVWTLYDGMYYYVEHFVDAEGHDVCEELRLTARRHEADFTVLRRYDATRADDAWLDASTVSQDARHADRRWAATFGNSGDTLWRLDWTLPLDMALRHGLGGLDIAFPGIEEGNVFLRHAVRTVGRPFDAPASPAVPRRRGSEAGRDFAVPVAAPLASDGRDGLAERTFRGAFRHPPWTEDATVPERLCRRWHLPLDTAVTGAEGDDLSARHVAVVSRRSLRAPWLGGLGASPEGERRTDAAMARGTMGRKPVRERSPAAAWPARGPERPHPFAHFDDCAADDFPCDMRIPG